MFKYEITKSSDLNFNKKLDVVIAAQFNLYKMVYQLTGDFIFLIEEGLESKRLKRIQIYLEKENSSHSSEFQSSQTPSQQKTTSSQFFFNSSQPGHLSTQTFSSQPNNNLTESPSSQPNNNSSQIPYTFSSSQPLSNNSKQPSFNSSTQFKENFSSQIPNNQNKEQKKDYFSFKKIQIKINNKDDFFPVHYYLSIFTAKSWRNIQKGNVLFIYFFIFKL
jgi:hypothetical protein